MQISSLESPVIIKVQVDKDGLVNHTVSSFTEDLDLKTMQAIVGGYIEIQKSKDGKYDIVMNEEGKLKSLPINKLATDLYDHPDDYIVGDVIIAPVGLIE